MNYYTVDVGVDASFVLGDGGRREELRKVARMPVERRKCVVCHVVCHENKIP